MKIISPANETIMTILGAAKEGTAFRMLHFVTEEPVKEGVLLYNLLTKELVLLSQEEYENRLELEYLRDKYRGLPIRVPRNYYPNDDETQPPIVRWRGHGNLLYSNWLNYFVYQTTPYDIMSVGKESTPI